MTRSLFDPLSFAHGRGMSNRLVLAPLTTCQSNADGTLSEDEYRWITLRAKGGFGLVLTCAANVQASGRGFTGQLGIYSDTQLSGLERLAQGLRQEGTVSAVQLYHAGRRAPAALTGEAPHSPWSDAETGARALSTAEIEQAVEDFVQAGMRAEHAGFDGIELHAAHGYFLAQFFDAERNVRTDRYGGSFENRTRILFEIIAGLRNRTGPDFQIGVRLSPERFGIVLAEALDLAQQVMDCNQVDYLDMSLWDVSKKAEAAAYAGKTLVELFASLRRGATRLGVAGRIVNGNSAKLCMAQGVDFVSIGRAAILHPDFPVQVLREPGFESVPPPVTHSYLRAQGLGRGFIRYLETDFKNFVARQQ
jgi:2,4-dienoyl-CoA reductase-like NADH-dependent reductase (Old Yellow Enzyme family)